ncbi:MAG: GTP cyclohydrolase II [Candidatus Eisenbacteria bacterium]|nr:GTP cyclohydrolase II [Candidatus Eisenbacteria bacterium]
MSQPEIDEVLEREANHDCAGVGEKKICVRIVAIADLPSRFGAFQIAGFWNNRDGREHVAIMRGNVFGQESVVTRVHSECLTGDALGSLRCDCRDQLEGSLRAIAGEERGLVLYLRQEGRGIGLLNKIRAYGLQDRGLDTVAANEALGFRDDEREYSIAAHMLMSLRVKSIRLMTNNPRKVEDLSRYRINIIERLPLMIPPNEHNRFYLQTKAAKSGHLIDGLTNDRLMEQGEPVRIEGMGAA